MRPEPWKTRACALSSSWRSRLTTSPGDRAGRRRSAGLLPGCGRGTERRRRRAFRGGRQTAVPITSGKGRRRHHLPFQVRRAGALHTARRRRGGCRRADRSADRRPRYGQIGGDRRRHERPPPTAPWPVFVDEASVTGVAAGLTPVPGGVGSVTTALLLLHAAEAAREQSRSLVLEASGPR